MRLIAQLMAIYLSIGACIPNSDFSQLMHLDDLKSHYIQHVQEAEAIGEEITLAEFLYLHFISEEDHDHDIPSDHSNLPLQNIISPISMYMESINIQEPIVYLDIRIKTSFPTPILLNNIDETKGIFHPPKV